jgi:hypothetical protein
MKVDTYMSRGYKRNSDAFPDQNFWKVANARMYYVRRLVCTDRLDSSLLNMPPTILPDVLKYLISPVTWS